MKKLAAISLAAILALLFVIQLLALLAIQLLLIAPLRQSNLIVRNCRRYCFDRSNIFFCAYICRSNVFLIWQRLRQRLCGSASHAEMRARNGWADVPLAESGILWLKRLWRQERR